MPVLPAARPFRYLPEVDPVLVEKAIAHLPAPARLVWLYAAVRPLGTLISRADLADYIDTDPAGPLEAALRELVDSGWFVEEPPGRPGRPDGLFRLAVDVPAPESESESAAEPIPDGLFSLLPEEVGSACSG